MITPTTHVTISPTMTAYHFFMNQRMSVTTRQNNDRRTPGSPSLPIANALPVPCVMIPALKSPTTAMKNPIPAEMASFMEPGISSRILSLHPDTVRIRNRIPDTNTTRRPCSNVNPIVRQMVYDKNAFTPIPGASATGNLE